MSSQLSNVINQLGQVQNNQFYIINQIWQQSMHFFLHAYVHMYTCMYSLGQGTIQMPTNFNTGGAVTTTSMLSNVVNSLPTPAMGSPASTNTTSTAFSASECSVTKVCQFVPINNDKLISPEEVIANYPKLHEKGKLSRLAVKLAQEAYFGKDTMKCCTVMGTGEYHALPSEQLSDLKRSMQKFCIPRFFIDNIKFEPTWKSCVESIGQSCKNLR